MKNKRVQFECNRDKVTRKLQGWKDKFFSLGGKEVLIKSVIQSILTYVMSCFTIPSTIIYEIESTCARFWWVSDKGQNKIYWTKWKNLCRPKAQGGLGFRDLMTSNQALLGKQIWRMVQKFQSLVAGLFKARYFLNNSIWEANKGVNSSFIWKSLLWGRNLVVLGMR
ncbi:hypothetical protein UlMin_042243 [Ulmus minor]